MTVGFVLDDGLDSTDGVQQYILTLGRWLDRQGHEVHYLVGKTSRTDIKNTHSLSRNFPVRFNKNRGTTPLPASAKAIKGLLNGVEFDVLHVQVPYSPFMAQRVINRAADSTAIIGTFHVLPHSALVRYATRLLGVWLKPSLKKFDKMLAVSPAAAAYARQVFGVESTVLPNVLDFQRFHDAKPLPRYEDNKLNIVFLGRLVERKGCMTLLEAANELVGAQAKLPEFRAVVCGDGPLMAKLKNFSRQKSLGKYVEFVGRVSEADKPRYLASADIAVFPSSGGESFGIVLIEALASGKSAVLAGDNPGYRSVMQGQPELLFPPTDAKSLAGKLKHFMKDAPARRQMAAWGEGHARQFDVDVVGKQLVKIYKQALRQHS